MSDEDIIKGITQGDEESFISLVDNYKNKIINLCYSFTYDYHEAEDLSQEIFINIYKNAHKFRGESSFPTYIYKISLHKCLDYKRKKSIKSLLKGLFNIESTYVEEELDEKSYIRKLVCELPEELKIPIILYYFVGLNQNEIGEILKVSTKAVEGRIYRAKKKLKKVLEKEGYGLCQREEKI